MIQEEGFYNFSFNWNIDTLLHHLITSSLHHQNNFQLSIILSQGTSTNVYQNFNKAKLFLKELFFQLVVICCFSRFKPLGF